MVHDGDAWTCKHCCCQWDASGEETEFTDDYGDDLAADLAKWESIHAATKEDSNA